MQSTFAKLTLCACLVTLSYATLYAFSLGDECYACSSAAEDAMVIDATSGLRTELTYYVIDRGHDQLRKFMIFYTPDGIPLSPEQNQEYAQISNYDGKSSQQINVFNLPDHTIAEIQPSLGELAVFSDYKVMLNDVFDITGPLPPRELVAQTDLTLPSGAIPGIDTAFDVRTNQHDLNVGLWIQNNHTVSAFTFTTIDKLSQMFGGRLVVNFTYTVFVTFPDGSSGIWEINDRDELDLVEGSLRDSDNNPIPRRTEEVNENGDFFFRGGESSNNAFRQADTATRLIFGPPAGSGGGNGGSCDWSCDEQACTLICRTE